MAKQHQPLCDTRALVLRAFRHAPAEQLRESVRQALLARRQQQCMLARLRAIGPEPLCLSNGVLENNPLRIQEPTHQRPKYMPGAVAHDAPEDPLQFGNAILLAPEVRESGISIPWIVNVTATFFAGVTFDLKQQAYINPRWPGHYNTLRFRTLTTKVLSDARPAPCTPSCKVYNNGLVSITNTRSPHQALLNAHAYTRMLQGAGVLDARMLNFKVDNIVAAGDFGFRVRLQCMVNSIADPSVMRYDPKSFPAAIYREKARAASDATYPPPSDARVAVLIFASGKVICVGFRSLEQLVEVHVKINRIARSFVCDANDMANASGGMSAQQVQQQMSDVDHLMYELICINAPDKAVAMLTQPPPTEPPSHMGMLGTEDMSLNAIGFSDLFSVGETQPPQQQSTPLLGQLTREGIEVLHQAIDDLCMDRTSGGASLVDGGGLSLLLGGAPAE